MKTPVRKLHAHWLASLSAVLSDLGAVPALADDRSAHGYRWRMPTLHGPLLLTVHEPHKADNGRWVADFSLFGRFDDGPHPAAANPFSGKWNYHPVNPQTVDESEAIVTEIFRRLYAMKNLPPAR